MKSDMDLELVKKIIKITEDADISGLAIQQGDFRVEVKREKLATVVAAQPASAHHAAPAAPAKGKDEEEEGVVAIVAPMVGTFYRAPSPDSSPYVEVGDKVEPGKTVCIIEAMKLFNEIEAEVRGEIVKIVAQDGQPVEYGQKLYLIRKG
jgi:acetyl-CoA carboxylase biotin carboxyl carrier protein